MSLAPLSELREEMRGVARGERRPSALPAAPLLAVLSHDALALLKLILRQHPASIEELVGLSGQSQIMISRSLQLLAGHQLVRLVRDGDAVRPEAVASELRVDLASGTYETIPVPP